jgi:hypothetical protein
MPITKAYLSATIICIVLLIPIPLVIHAHWMLLDDQLIVDHRLWPLDSQWNDIFHRMGRDALAYGVYYRLLSLAAHLHAPLYYLANYSFYAGTVVLLSIVVWSTTRNAVLTALAGLAAALASSGPEVFMTLFKTEEQMMFFVALFLFLMSRARPIPILLAATASLSIVFGKETAVPLFAGGLAGLLIWLLSPGARARDAWRSIGAILTGVALAFVYRHAVGIKSPTAGSYTGSLLTLKDAASIWFATKFYLFYTSDVFVLLAIGFLAGLVALIRREGSPAGFFALGAAAAVAAFYIALINFLQIYYIYPVGLLAPVAIACLAPKVRALRIATIAALALGVIASAPEYYNRLLAFHYVPAAEHRMMAAIAGLPKGVTVAIPYAPDSEMSSNIGILMRDLWRREDIRFATGGAPGAQYLLVLSEGPRSWRIGGRGLPNRTLEPSDEWRRKFAIGPLVVSGGETLKLWVPPRIVLLFGLPRAGFADLTFGWEIFKIEKPT